MMGWTPSGVFSATAYGAFASLVFAGLLVTACVTDVRVRRIPNRLVLWLAGFGIIYSVTISPWPAGIVRTGEGFALGLALWFPFYVLRWIGAGDVKLFAAASTWLGAGIALRAAALAAVFGGMLSLAWMLRRHGWWVTLLRVRYGLVDSPPGMAAGAATADERRVPYGVAMAAGLLAAACFPALLF